MAAKGKEKKEVVRSARSKSPARMQKGSSSPPAGTPGKQQARGRSRSKSPARTPVRSSSRSRSPARSAKASASKTEPAVKTSRKSEPVPSAKLVAEPEVEEPEKASDETAVPLRSSGRRAAAVAASAALITQRKIETVTKVVTVGPVEAPQQQAETKQSPSQSCCIWMQHLDQFASGLLLVVLTAVALSTSLMCNLDKCNFSALPKLPSRIASYFDVKAVLIVVGWFLFQLMLANIPVGWRRAEPPMPDASRYRCNGPFALAITLLGIGALVYSNQPIYTTLRRLFVQLLVATIALVVVISIWCYRRAQSLAANKLTAPSRTGLVAFVFGREAQPHLGSLNLKIFSVVHFGMLGWASTLSVIVLHAYQTSALSCSLATVATLQFVYILDFVLFEASLENSVLISHDTLGFVSVFMSAAWLPFVSSIQLRHLLVNGPQTTNHVIGGVAVDNLVEGVAVLLFAVGFVISRTANLTKDRFRRQLLSFKPYQLVQTSSGKPLLATGLWAWCRHPNYFGCLLMTVGWSLPCGLCSPVTYAYILYTFALFALRAYRDANLCEKKHGSTAWNQYCQRVRSRIIPFIY